MSVSEVETIPPAWLAGLSSSESPRLDSLTIATELIRHRDTALASGDKIHQRETVAAVQSSKYRSTVLENREGNFH